ncbi:serine/threonine-protein phosphatase 6 regulatory ankyrin repeat subunit B-like [Physella acuta]|uniref:serine/threonine-protein phosphatase 6 regulatory ankyrin repeat subunit B-like n=1 Tax=Physella acuta TaxID=109671 RepID=UPI0027DB9EB6|nr:serine/threonine-protein phosphatase 6 regulatory ankyrin repeat subunit B-like [Physella acuta]
MVLTDTRQIYERAHLGGSLNELKEQIDYRDELGQTALMHAVVEDNDHDTTALKNLLTFGADPNVVSSQQRYTTALTIAVNLRKVEHVRELIRAGAFFICERGFEALKIARENNFLDDVLIGDEAMKTRPHFSKEKNAFHVAYKYKCFDLLLDLINYGVTTSITSIDLSDLARADLFNVLMNSAKTDIDEQDDKVQTTLMRAVQHNKTQIVQSLIQKGACLDVVNLEGEMALHIACRGPVDMVKILLDAGAKTEIYNKNNLTPLAVATQIIKLLIQNGADVMVVDGHGRSPIHIAAARGSLEIVESLRQSGADINVVDKYGNSPLFVSILYNHKELTKYLLECGADHGAVVDKGKDSELLAALRNQNVDLVNIFHGARISERDNEGNTCVHVAARFCGKEVLEMLIDLKADVDVQNNNVKHSMEETVQHLIQNGAYVNVININGETPIHFASTVTIAKRLLDAKSDLNIQNHVGEKPLLSSIKRDKDLVASLLIENGADLNFATSTGETALMYAADLQNFTLFQLLVEGGANVNIQDSEGRTPLMHVVLRSVTLSAQSNNQFESCLWNIGTQLRLSIVLSFGKFLQVRPTSFRLLLLH